MTDAVIRLTGLNKCFHQTAAVREVSLEVARGTLLALLGASGCGKTTTLRLIAGLEKPDAGEVWLEGRPVAGAGAWVPPEGRRVGMVFQDYALFPHLTVAENVAFPLERLNGHRRERVALARALAPRPAVVLLDEPFSNLDAALRSAMRAEVRHILRATGTTAIIVTHDQEEALSLADRVAVMQAGQIVQEGTPQEVYLRPASHALAEFMGEANFLSGVANGRTVTCALGRLLLAAPAAGPVEVMIRPEAIKLTPELDGLGHLEQLTFFGHDQMAVVSITNGPRLRVRTWAQPDLSPGLAVNIRVLGPVVAFAAPPVL